MSLFAPVNRPQRLAAVATVLAILAAVTAGSSPAPDDSHSPPPERRPAPLFQGLGTWTHPVSTQSVEAQRYFDQGLMFCYGFNHKEAIRSFAAAAELDPNLAMAWWGIAFAHGPNINAPMFDGALPSAVEALDRAIALKDQVSPRDRAYIEALTARYSRDEEAERSTLDQAFAAAMREVAEKYPDDLDASVLYADAVMNTMAWDYWLPDRSPKPAALEVIAVLDRVLSREPMHPGANHAYIHLIEAGPEPWRALPSADRLVNYAPDSGHLLHMPSHIYIRTGQYERAVAVNEVAAAADWDYIAQCQAQGFYPGLYYPHNLHFLWYALTFEGRAEDCIQAAREVARYASSPLCGTEIVEAPRLLHLPLVSQARFGRWDDILATTQAPSDGAMDRLMYHYARALAFAAVGRASEAKDEASKVAELVSGDDLKALDNQYLPAMGIGQVAKHLAAAKAARASGDRAGELAELEAAVAAEQALPYMEPAFWYFPTRQSLAAALLQHGDAAAAEKHFRQDLQDFPRNGWSLHGLAAALEAQDRTDDARLVQREFAQAWARADVKPELNWY